MKRPVLIATIGYIIGIIWGLYFKISIALIIPIMLLIILKIYNKNAYLKVILNKKTVITIIIFSLISNCIINNLNRKYDYLYKNINEVELIGTIISNKKEKEYNDEYIIKIDMCNKSRKFNNTKLIIKIKKQKNKINNIKYGDKIILKGIFEQPTAQRNYKGFNYKEYLKSIEIYGIVYSNINQIKLIKENNINIISSIANTITNKAKDNIVKRFPEESAQLIMGILLGAKDNIEESTIEQFRNSSLSHILAVSGLHISYIILGITYLLKISRISSRIAKIFSIFFLIFFTIIVGYSPSIARACIMGCVSIASGIFFRKSDSITNISLATLIILILNPFSIINIGFLLSFIGTVGIIVLNNNITIFMDKIYVIKNNFVNNILSVIKPIISITISVQLIIFPIIVIYFGTISYTFIISNILTSHIIGLIIILGFIFIILSFISLNLSNIIICLLNILLSYLKNITGIISSFSISKLTVIRPNIFIICIYYLTLFLLNYIYTLYNKKSLRTTEKKIIKFLKNNYIKIIIITIILMLITNIFSVYKRHLSIYFIDIGQGDSCLIVTPKNKKILIDGGGNKNEKEFNVGDQVLIPYLLARGIKTIDYVMVSHFDIDHCQGLFSVIKQLTVKNVIIGKQFETSENYEKFKKIVREKKIKVHVVEAGQRIKIEKDLYFDVLWPSSNNAISENGINNNSLVCKLVYQNFSMLFTGDIEEIAEKDILEKYKNMNVLQSTILKVAHHGSKSSSIQEFLDAVKPKIVLIGVGEKNTFGHPNNGVLERIERMWK